MDDIRLWLDQNGLGRYAKVFAENAVDLEVLPELTEEDLKELGIPLGDRRKLQRLIKRHEKPTEPSSEKRKEHIKETAQKESTNKKRPKKSILVWLGAAVILVGLFLPWVKEVSEITGRATLTGIDFLQRENQGVVALALGAVNILLGFIAAGRTFSARAASLGIIIAGVATIGIALNALEHIKQENRYQKRMHGRVEYRLSEDFGVGVTLTGGGIVILGGVMALGRSLKRIRVEAKST
jgi:hypothetical protein